VLNSSLSKRKIDMTLEGTITRTRRQRSTQISKSLPNPRATAQFASAAPGRQPAKPATTTSPSPSTLAQVKSAPTRSKPRMTVNIASSPTRTKTSGAGNARAFRLKFAVLWGFSWCLNQDGFQTVLEVMRQSLASSSQVGILSD